jgi:hypothetical protein
MSSPVARARDVLAAASFSPLPLPVEVAGIPFRFSAVLASDRSLDLVVLIDTFESGPEEEVRREVAGLARALDLAKSRRPLTVVLIGQRWSEVTERAMTRVARVLRCEVVVESEEARDSALRDALAVLLPLELTPARDQPDESWSTVKAGLQRDLADPELGTIIAAASRGPESVKKALLQFLAQPLGPDADV